MWFFLWLLLSINLWFILSDWLFGYFLFTMLRYICTISYWKSNSPSFMVFTCEAYNFILVIYLVKYSQLWFWCFRFFVTSCFVGERHFKILSSCLATNNGLGWESVCVCVISSITENNVILSLVTSIYKSLIYTFWLIIWLFSIYYVEIHLHNLVLKI